MWGKKVRVYYHGIPLFCVHCYEIGHNRFECANEQVTWKQYIDKLASGFKNTEIFGTWLTTNQSLARESQSDIPQPHLLDEEEESDEEFDLHKIPPKMLKLLKKKLEGPKTSTAVKKPKPKVKKLKGTETIARGHGRGGRGTARGRGVPLKN